ncbi:TetR/AcrR family transcriptional regulator [Pseudomonas capsici]|uniref:TetR/AcrR family transcriptional regulator n=1 Tax=Pseudomonas capsici TaxID=2810614 RepID=UPI0013C33D94|nr:TetR/AcrR family transcriptional regulator [Pseudomonas capsici]MCV4281892.1 TetR/AcrR family transcriptional regulator [Pseudomonas capsici]
MKAPMRLTDQKRESIVLAAIAEFRDRGFEITSMDRIAARAEVSKRTVYNHFPSKEELFSEIIQRLWTCAAPSPHEPYKADKSLREQMRDLLRHKMDTLADSNFLDLARVVVGATVHSPDRAQAWMTRINEREEAFSVWIRAAQKDGRLKPVDPGFAAAQVHALLKAFAFWPQLTLNAESLTPEKQADVIESTLDMFLGCYEIKASH